MPDILVTSWRLPHNICYGEVTGKLVPVEFELNTRRPRRKTAPKKILRKVRLRKGMWTTGFRYSRRKINAAA